MTRSYEAADKSHLEWRSDFTIMLAFHISALSKLNLLLFWDLFCSFLCILYFKGCTSPTTVHVRFH